MLGTDCVSVVLVGQRGYTALHKAAMKNSLEVAKVLLAAKANIVIKTNVRAKLQLDWCLLLILCLLCWWDRLGALLFKSPRKVTIRQ